MHDQQLGNPANMTIEQVTEAVGKYLRASKSKNTRDAYRRDWAKFTTWADSHNIDTMPASPATVVLFVSWMAETGSKITSIQRMLTTISQAHLAFGKQPPNNHPKVIEVMRGIRREKGLDLKKAKPLLLADLKKVLSRIAPSFLGKRDRALLLVGWAAALRRSEIVALNVEDIDFVDKGCVVTIRRSKTDQLGAGYKLGLPTGADPKLCPTRALLDWIETAEIKTGVLFPSLGTPGKLFAQLDLLRAGNTDDLDLDTRLTPRSVNIIIARRLKKAGLRPEGYSGHSLRSGYITSAARKKIPEYAIQAHTRHRSVKVLRGYIERDLFEDNPLSMLI
jgi:integrase